MMSGIAKRLSAALAAALLVLALTGINGTFVRPRAENAGDYRGLAARLETLFPRDESHDYAAPAPGSYTLAPIKRAGDGEVLDTDGRAHRLSSLLAGRITVLGFVYTLCSDARGCPLAMATLYDIFDASEKLPEIAGRAQLLTLSFDPGRDTPEVMRAYGTPVAADRGRAKKLPWRFLTTASAKKLAPILATYGQVIDQRADSEVISHLLRLYLIDRSGRVRNIYGSATLDPRLLFGDIVTLMMEDDGIGPKPKS